MNILVTAVGSISGPFVVDSLLAMGHRVFGVDIHPRQWIAAAEKSCVFSQVPPVEAFEDYERALLSLCIQHNIKMLIPMTDPEVDFLCMRTAAFELHGVKVAAPKYQAVELMRNKKMLFEHFRNSALPVIPTFQLQDYLAGCGLFPCISKPVKGRSSEEFSVFPDKNSFDQICTSSDQYIFQPFIHGEVVVVDVLNSTGDTLVTIARKELTRSKNGAGIAVQILRAQDSNLLHQHIRSFCNFVEFDGCINMEFIQPKLGEFLLMDVNPRFSAGVAFSGLAGYNFVQNHVLHHAGEKVRQLGPIQEGAIYTRKYTEVIV